MSTLWAGVDAGKHAHHCVVIDEQGVIRLSQRVDNDEQALLGFITTVTRIEEDTDLCWATDLTDGSAALLIGLLASMGMAVVYIPGRVIYHAAATYRGDGKTDAKDARIIADQARMRTDLRAIPVSNHSAIELRLLVARRLDVVHDRVRTINRLRATLLEYFPALERAFDYSKNKAALILLSRYQTPGSLRRIGETRLASWLKKSGARNSTVVAQTAVNAAKTQRLSLPAEHLAAQLVADLATQLSGIDEQLSSIDTDIEARVARNPTASLLTSLPGFGPILAATFYAEIGGSLDNFASASHLATLSGLAPVPRDSGRISGNLHRPRRFNRRLLRTCYLAAFSSLKNNPASRLFYDRKPNEGKSHQQAIIALARRRINVIWAMLRDNTTYQHPSPTIVHTT